MTSDNLVAPERAVLLVQWCQYWKMGARSAVSVLVAAALIAVGLLSLGRRTWAAVPERGVEFQDGVGNAQQSIQLGQAAVFYVRDASLRTVQADTGIWAAVPARVPANSWWSLATGGPHPGVYALSQGTSYDRDTPSNTPLASVPTASVNGVPFLLSNLNAATGEFALLNDVNTSSSAVVDFTFDIVDVYTAGQHRVKVTSTSDTDGEWVSMSEVVSETDANSNPTSGAFRGEAVLSASSEAQGPGDGKVWVQAGDALTATYFEPDGVTPISSHQVQVEFPTPTAIPVADWFGLSVLAGAFALLGAGWLLRQRDSGRREEG